MAASRTARIEKLMRLRLNRAVAAGAGVLHDYYHRKITAHQVTNPDGTCRTGDRSCPGEYPYRDTGAGEENWQDIGVVRGDLQAAVGLTEEGIHLAVLARAPWNRRGFGLNGAFQDALPQIQSAVISASG